LRELDRLLARHREEAAVYAIFLSPAGVPAGWEQTDTWNAAAAIPGVQALADRQGRLKKAFCASASGECLLYDAQGRLRFHGGITPGRGHEGDSLGQASLAALLKHGASRTERTPVFGCALEPSRTNKSAIINSEAVR
jgi:hypothetical protein